MIDFIGLSGWQNAGKDTVAKILSRRFGFEIVGLADAVKLCVERLDPWVPIDSGILAADGKKMTRLRRMSEILKEMYDAGFEWRGAWDRAKQIPEVRRLLQRMGTEVGRQTISVDVWVDIVERYWSKHEGPIVVQDVRFENERLLVARCRGQLWRIDRPGYGAQGDHLSEHVFSEEEADVIIDNNGTLDDLETNVTMAVLEVETT